MSAIRTLGALDLWRKLREAPLEPVLLGGGVRGVVLDARHLLRVLLL